MFNQQPCHSGSLSTVTSIYCPLICFRVNWCHAPWLLVDHNWAYVKGTRAPWCPPQITTSSATTEISCGHRLWMAFPTGKNSKSRTFGPRREAAAQCLHAQQQKDWKHLKTLLLTCWHCLVFLHKAGNLHPHSSDTQKCISKIDTCTCIVPHGTFAAVWMAVTRWAFLLEGQELS